MELRIGQGFDAHKFIQERPLILGGLHIPYKFGLDGHSDADVLIHAIIDSILGALSLGDIGKWFPDSDTKYKNINSMKLLEQVLQSKELYDWSLVNLDATIIAQNPKLSQYTQLIQQNLANAFNSEIKQISIKAKTTEGMGFCGRSEGIAVLVNILMQKH
jgi:2-C-methyl-D-erythritol 2,4-cyclodiphosphate synthase